MAKAGGVQEFVDPGQGEVADEDGAGGTQLFGERAWTVRPVACGQGVVDGRPT
ncbi:hypothetical protein ACIQVK_18495 [Streptomyces sp. NPDC090493]|uniref:hypothetical protein n=1 Tax=Streptomyces sp. NPDC090493 TaxID=3365964 RepID=UPI00381342B1